jgi:hypothetical protein
MNKGMFGFRFTILIVPNLFSALLTHLINFFCRLLEQSLIKSYIRDLSSHLPLRTYLASVISPVLEKIPALFNFAKALE